MVPERTSGDSRPCPDLILAMLSCSKASILAVVKERRRESSPGSLTRMNSPLAILLSKFLRMSQSVASPVARRRASRRRERSSTTASRSILRSRAKVTASLARDKRLLDCGELLRVLPSRLGGRDNLPWVICVLRCQGQVEALHFLPV